MIPVKWPASVSLHADRQELGLREDPCMKHSPMTASWLPEMFLEGTRALKAKGVTGVRIRLFLPNRWETRVAQL